MISIIQHTPINLTRKETRFAMIFKVELDFLCPFFSGHKSPNHKVSVLIVKLIIRIFFIPSAITVGVIAIESMGSFFLGHPVLM